MCIRLGTPGITKENKRVFVILEKMSDEPRKVQPLRTRLLAYLVGSAEASWKTKIR